MSDWLEAEKKDISLSDKKDEIHIWFESNVWGSRYISVKIEDMLEVLREKGIINR
jgi:hypothetical protein